MRKLSGVGLGNPFVGGTKVVRLGSGQAGWHLGHLKSKVGMCYHPMLILYAVGSVAGPASLGMTAYFCESITGRSEATMLITQ